jgi:hypothetical protein
MGGAQRATFQLGRADLDSVSLHSLGAPPKVKVVGRCPTPCQGPHAPGPRIPPGRCAWRKALPRAVRGFCAPKFYGLAASKNPGRLSSARGEKSKDFRGTTRDFRTRSRVSPYRLRQKAMRITPPHVPSLLSAGKPRLWAGRLRDQYTRRAACLLAPPAGSLKGSRSAFFPSQSFPISVYGYILIIHGPAGFVKV